MNEPLHLLVENALASASDAEFTALQVLLADALACGSAAVREELTDADHSEASQLARAFSALDLDDIDWKSVHHPGSVVISAALESARRQGCTGERLTSAIAAGYRIAGNIGRLFNGEYRRTWHATAVCGALGASVASTLIYREDPELIEVALNLAAASVGGLSIAPRARNGAAVFTRSAAATLGVLASKEATRRRPYAADALFGENGLADALGALPLNNFHEWDHEPVGILSSSLRLFPVTGFAHAAVWATNQFVIELGAIKSVEVVVSPAAYGLSGVDKWWNIPAAVAQAVVAENPFRCNQDSSTPFDLIFSQGACDVTESIVELNRFDGTKIVVRGFAPGSLQDSDVAILFERKLEEVLNINPRLALECSTNFLRAGIEKDTNFDHLMETLASD